MGIAKGKGEVTDQDLHNMFQTFVDDGVIGRNDTTIIIAKAREVPLASGQKRIPPPPAMPAVDKSPPMSKSNWGPYGCGGSLVPPPPSGPHDVVEARSTPLPGLGRRLAALKNLLE